MLKKLLRFKKKHGLNKEEAKTLGLLTLLKYDYKKISKVLGCHEQTIKYRVGRISKKVFGKEVSLKRKSILKEFRVYR